MAVTLVPSSFAENSGVAGVATRLDTNASLVNCGTEWLSPQAVVNTRARIAKNGKIAGWVFKKSPRGAFRIFETCVRLQLGK